MRYKTGRIGIVVGIALVLVSVSTGQVRQIGGGQALDASLQVGSGGVNYAVPQNYMPNTGISSMTQSRGLSAFKGHAPTISNQISVGVNTGGVDRFQQQSVGVRQAEAGGAAVFNPKNTYYDSPYRTFLRPSDIVQANYGRRVPIAGGQPASKNVKMAEDLFVDATSNFKPIMPTDVDDMMVGNALSLPQDQGGTSSNYDLWLRSMDSKQLAERGGKDMFGMLRQEDRADLAQQISDFDKADEAPGALNLAVQPAEDTAPIQPVDPRLKTTDLSQPEATNLGLLSTPKTDETDKEQQSQTPSPSASQQIDLRTGLPQTNSDPYFDMLAQFRQRQLAETNAIPPGQQQTDLQPTIGQAQEPTETEEQPAPRGQLNSMDEALLQRMKTAVPLAGRPHSIELTPDNKIIVHRLAGEADDAFNRYMRRAESAMKAKRFYEAARQYNLATVAKPTNPMGYLGVCMSNFASNEWLTSATGLRKAMELFPPLMETRMDLRRLIPIDDWPQQLKLMEQWVQKVDNQPMILFLATFIEHNAGRADVAQKHAKTLLSQKNLPKIIHAYAQYITTGKYPTEAKSRRKTRAEGK